MICRSNVQDMLGPAQMEEILFFFGQLYGRLRFTEPGVQIGCRAADYIHLRPVFFRHSPGNVIVRLNNHHAGRIDAGIRMPGIFPLPVILIVFVPQPWLIQRRIKR